MTEKNSYKPLDALEISALTKILITSDGKGTRFFASALSKLLLDAYNEGIETVVENMNNSNNG